MDLVQSEIWELAKACGFGFFLYDILNRFDKICLKIQKSEYIEKYERIKNSLKESLNKNAWDGNWFVRAYTDDGKTLGHSKNEECKIDSIAQSWAVISGAVEGFKATKAMESLEENLIDKNARNNQTLRPTF